MLNPDDALNRIAKIPNKEERDVATLLHDMGLDFVCSNKEVRDCPEQAIGEVDLIFGSGDIMIIIEVGAGRHKISRKKENFFSKWKDESNVKALKMYCGLQYQKTAWVYFDLRPKPENPGLADTKIMAETGSMDKIYYKDDYDDFIDRVKGKNWHKNDFLAELGSDILGDADC